MEGNLDLGRNKMYHLEKYVIMYGVYSAEAIEKTVTTI